MEMTTLLAAEERIGTPRGTPPPLAWGGLRPADVCRYGVALPGVGARPSPSPRMLNRRPSISEVGQIAPPRVGR